MHLNERLLKTFIVVKSDSAIEHTTTLGKQLILKTSGLPKPKTELENCYHLFFRTAALTHLDEVLRPKLDLEDKTI